MPLTDGWVCVCKGQEYMFAYKQLPHIADEIHNMKYTMACDLYNNAFGRNRELYNHITIIHTIHVYIILKKSQNIPRHTFTPYAQFKSGL